SRHDKRQGKCQNLYTAQPPESLACVEFTSRTTFRQRIGCPCSWKAASGSVHSTGHWLPVAGCCPATRNRQPATGNPKSVAEAYSSFTSGENHIVQRLHSLRLGKRL